MLARHLLFIATRRPHNVLLTIPSPETVPAHVIAQPPPPYIGPPKPEDRQQKAHKYREILKETQASVDRAQHENQSAHERARGCQPEFYCRDARQPLRRYNDGMPNYECQRAYDARRTVQTQNARNQQYSMPRDVNQHFYTLPTRRPQREVEPPRSVTPDITRGLARGSLSGMHVLARQAQKPTIEQDVHANRFAQVDPNGRRSIERLEAKNGIVQGQQPTPIVDVKNRFTAPLSLAALGYRFFASSPVNEPIAKSASTEALKHNPISPIAHGYGNGLKSSTPTGRSMPTVAERLAITTGNCSSPVPSSSGRSTPIQTSSGRSTPTNLILSPTKSTMSNEELFAAIHKSKKRLNIKDDCENLSPYGSMNSLVKAPAGTRHSWSPESQKQPEIPQTVHSPSTTSRLDFKRLLLQQSVKSGPTRLSAAEQLKLSRQQCQQYQQSSCSVQTPLTKVLSPRSVWRFQTPRTDVLSSTIIEDTAAEEKAMKPSPENTSPISRLNSRRQLNLCNDTPTRFDADNRNATCERKNESNLINERLQDGVQNLNSINSKFERKDNRHELFDNQPRINQDRLLEPILNEQSSTIGVDRSKASDVNFKAVNANPSTQYSQTQRSQGGGAVSAFESRRISNQLARAQFLASTPMANQDQSLYFKKRFRARSESPQQNNSQNVARSPSAPTLETAL